MSCFSPLKAYQVVDQRTGELRQIFAGVDLVTFMREPVPPGARRLIIPCGQCEGCRSDRAHQWANRLTLESTVNVGRSWFVTLTYDDKHLPRLGRQILDRETGVVGDLPVVNMDDVSSWIKRLRSRLHQPLRFFSVSEYGELSRRPHYHVILFADLPDLQQVRIGVDGATVNLPPGTFWSRLISETWGLGGITVQEANAWAMSYVAGYAVKKLKGRLAFDYAAECDALGVDQQPAESARMSRRPGIGVPWLEKTSQDAASGSVAVPTPDGSFSAPTPRVFERYVDPDRVQEYKERRLRESEANMLRVAQLRPGEYIEKVKDARARVRAKRARVRAQKL